MTLGATLVDKSAVSVSCQLQLCNQACLRDAVFHTARAADIKRFRIAALSSQLKRKERERYRRKKVWYTSATTQQQLGVTSRDFPRAAFSRFPLPTTSRRSRLRRQPARPRSQVQTAAPPTAKLTQHLLLPL